MAKDQGVSTPTQRRPRPAARAPGPAKPVVAAPGKPTAPRRRTSPQQFAREVRLEARKISWPSWKETWITSVMVFIMVAITSIFFLVTDGALSLLLQQVLKLAG